MQGLGQAVRAPGSSANTPVIAIVGGGFCGAALGIDVAPDGRVISRDGSAVDRLYHLGPWLRARDWEATAVPELRELAARLAAHLEAKYALALSA